MPKRSQRLTSKHLGAVLVTESLSTANILYAWLYSLKLCHHKFLSRQTSWWVYILLSSRNGFMEHAEKWEHHRVCAVVLFWGILNRIVWIITWLPVKYWPSQKYVLQFVHLLFSTNYQLFVSVHFTCAAHRPANQAYRVPSCHTKTKTTRVQRPACKTAYGYVSDWQFGKNGWSIPIFRIRNTHNFDAGIEAKAGISVVPHSVM